MLGPIHVILMVENFVVERAQKCFNRCRGIRADITASIASRTPISGSQLTSSQPFLETRESRTGQKTFFPAEQFKKGTFWKRNNIQEISIRTSDR